MDELQKEQNGRVAEGTGNLANLTPIVDSQSQFVDSLDQPLVCKDYRLLFTSKYISAWRPGALSTQHNPT